MCTQLRPGKPGPPGDSRQETIEEPADGVEFSCERATRE